MEEPIHIPVTDELDLHTFRPAEVRDLIEDYLEVCAQKGFDRVRIIHGKGTGKLRQRVHSVLKNHKAVARFELASGDAGGWGATVVWLERPNPFPSDRS